MRQDLKKINLKTNQKSNQKQTKRTSKTSETASSKTDTSSFAQSFHELNLHPSVIEQLDRMKFTQPSEIQAKVIPLVLSRDKDVIGVAQTGTGKTGAFGIPLISHLTQIQQEQGVDMKQRTPQVIILAPTRELALQVSSELEKFSAFNKQITVVTIYGGAPITRQQRELKKGCEIVVGTPGRVVDMIKRKDLKLENCSNVVLDEADEMLKMGFVEDLEFILQTTPTKRKTYLFSATMPLKIKQLSQKYMSNQEIVTVEKKQEVTNLISQEYYSVDRTRKLESLIHLISSIQKFHAIIFCRTRADVDTLTLSLNSNGFKADCIHGDISQNKREKILQDFKNSKFSILVATDVAARGIHVDNVTHVVNYTLPDDVETYTHRIGRTGRAGNSGVALSFVTRQEMFKLKQIERELNVSVVRKELPSQSQIEELRHKYIIDDIKQSIKHSGLNSKPEKSHDKKRYELVENIIDELSTHFSQEEIIFSLIEKELGNSNRGSSSSHSNTSKHENKKGNVDFQSNLKERKIFVAKGKADKFSKKSLLTFLEKEAGVQINNVKAVDVCESFSFVTLNAQVAGKIVESFRSKKARNGKSLVEFSSN
ncbi:MAG: DEAD/DEAH box helicase [Candidatus Nanoarchaeia archaeon]